MPDVNDDDDARTALLKACQSSGGGEDETKSTRELVIELYHLLIP